MENTVDGLIIPALCTENNKEDIAIMASETILLTVEDIA